LRVTIEGEDAVLERARLFVEIHDDSLLINDALRALIERESGRRVAALGGSEPRSRPIPRRRMPRQTEAKADPLRG
jgi:Bacterial antitoxin of type II TA system, VapB